MQARAAGALAVMAIDPAARRRLFDLDPQLHAFLQAVHDHFPAGAYTRSLFQLNLSALYGIGGARRGCIARVKGMLSGV